MGQAVGLASTIGAGLGTIAMMTPPIKKRINAAVAKNPKSEMILMLLPTLIGGILAMIPVAPLMAWAAKTQVKASKQGRFEAMRKDLNDPVKFATLTEEQIKEADEAAKKEKVEDKKNSFLDEIKGPIKMFKALFQKDKQYAKDKTEFEKNLLEHEKQFDKKLSPEQIAKAKKRSAGAEQTR